MLCARDPVAFMPRRCRNHLARSLALVAHPVRKRSVDYLCGRANTLRRVAALGNAYQDGDAIRSVEVCSNVFDGCYRPVLDFILEVAPSFKA